MNNKELFSSKAHALECLRGKLKSAQVLPATSFTSIRWVNDRNSVLKEIIENEFFLKEVIVRSSCALEDSLTGSNAGAFLSQRSLNDKDQLIAAIDSVMNSYGRVSEDDYIFVQPYLANTLVNGVAFNREPQTGARYDVINYTLTTDTAAVTSGCSENIKAHISFCDVTVNEEPIKGVLCLLRELETLLGDIGLDVEFAVNEFKQLIILQVRPLVSVPKPKLTKEKHYSVLTNVQKFLAKSLGSDPNLLGKKGVLGVMPDWNPAEIIGLKPRPLAFSLYRYLITDSVWAKGRSQYGYKDTHGTPLMVSLYGLPYIDVRASFNSFIPKILPNEIAERMIESCIKRLISNPYLHDKVEFEVIPTCYNFEIDERLATLDETLSKEDKMFIRSSLAEITKSFIAGESRQRIAQDEINLNLLRSLQNKVISKGTVSVNTIYQLLCDCKRLGTNAFAGLARAAFVGTDLLRSAVSKGIISEESSSKLLLSLETPTSKFLEDLSILSRDRFLSIYGHLRPGTYDIRIPNYAEKPDQYFADATKTVKESIKKWELPIEEEVAMNKMISAEGFDFDAQTVVEFMRYSMAARERAKFIFSRSVSHALDLIAKIGEENGFSRDELSYANIFDIFETRMSSLPIKEALHRSIESGYKQYQITSQLNFPSLITKPEDIMQFELLNSKPNFITNKIAEGEVVDKIQDKKLKGAIAMIPNADPGFDWLFSHDIAGFITAFGGSNSHMAIRAAELGIPAIIGAGESFYNKWVSAKYLRLDCATEKVEILLS